MIEEPARAAGASATPTGTSHLSFATTRSTIWWTVWAGVAVEALRRSEAARQARLSGENWYPHWRYEMEDGLVAVTGSVFAIEGITRELATVDDLVDPKTRSQWAEKRRDAAWRTREVLKRSIHGAEGQALGDQWRPLINRRNGVVHFAAEQRPSVSYDGMNVAVEEAEFTAVEAAKAVGLLFATVDALGGRPKPAMRGHSARYVGQLEELRERRAVGGVSTG